MHLPAARRPTNCPPCRRRPRLMLPERTEAGSRGLERVENEDMTMPVEPAITSSDESEVWLPL